MNAWIASKPESSVNKAIAELTAKQPQRIADANGDGHMAVWLYAVDRIIVGRFGIGHRDLPDQAWRERYDADMSPADAAGEAIELWREYGDVPEDSF
ncbi:hypothetical protein LH935_28430 (plasmid) [Gordonia polyisoprenivorans]|uniref:hypothetical protein n=1 Tax=Gordonia polyisoprenivorans TaxID=84595 RepID=UPI00223467F0|nr:hypothetical protein LH935_28430 [Gordonia polyisoprenivorans]